MYNPGNCLSLMGLFESVSTHGSHVALIVDLEPCPSPHPPCLWFTGCRNWISCPIEFPHSGYVYLPPCGVISFLSLCPTFSTNFKLSLIGLKLKFFRKNSSKVWLELHVVFYQEVTMSGYLTSGDVKKFLPISSGYLATPKYSLYKIGRINAYFFVFTLPNF